jgi:uncharacterized protein (TIGR03000 family)
MNRWSNSLGKLTLALAILATTATFVSAQTPNGNPYWDSAPSSYRGSDIDYATRPVPGPPRDPFGPTRSVYSGVGIGWLSPGSGSYSYLANVHSSGGRRLVPFNDSALGELPRNAHISLAVPADAQVWFDGNPTRQTGTLRHYTSPPLTPGPTYTYTVRVRWMKDGTPVDERRRVRVHSGAWVQLNFTPSGGTRAPGA